jgi:hypothetical protein
MGVPGAMDPLPGTGKDDIKITIPLSGPASIGAATALGIFSANPPTYNLFTGPNCLTLPFILFGAGVLTDILVATRK